MNHHGVEVVDLPQRGEYRQVGLGFDNAEVAQALGAVADDPIIVMLIARKIPSKLLSR